MLFSPSISVSVEFRPLSIQNNRIFLNEKKWDLFIFAYFLSIRKRCFSLSISYFSVENWLKCPTAQNLPKECEGPNRLYSNILPKTLKKKSGKKVWTKKMVRIVILAHFLSSGKRCFTLFISYFNVENWLNCPSDQNLSKKRKGRNRWYSNIVHVPKTVKKNGGEKVRFDVELLEFCENDGSSKSWRFEMTPSF